MVFYTEIHFLEMYRWNIWLPIDRLLMISDIRGYGKDAFNAHCKILISSSQFIFLSMLFNVFQVNPTDTDSDLDDLHAELDIMEHDVVDEANDPALDNISIDDSDIEAADLAEENYNQHQHDEDEDGDGEHIVDNPSNVSSDDESDGGRDQLPHTDPNQAAQESNTGDTLYKGSRLSLTLSVLLIATFVMRHGLSGECVGDLLTLIELHCLSENICITSLRMYNTFLSKKKASVVPHYFCEYCMTYFGLVLPDLCPVCRKASPKSRGAMNYFVVNPLNDILKTAFSRKYHVIFIYR